MNEQEQVGPRRRRRSRAEAGQLVVEYEASGLSRAEFCRGRGLSWATLLRYRKWHREAGVETSPGIRWVSVELSGVVWVARTGSAASRHYLTKCDCAWEP